MTTVNEANFKVIEKVVPTTTKMSFTAYMQKLHTTACKMRENGIKEDVIDRKIRSMVMAYYV